MGPLISFSLIISLWAHMWYQMLPSLWAHMWYQMLPMHGYMCSLRKCAEMLF